MGAVAVETRTLCPYCGVGCGLLTRVEGGRLLSVAGDPSYPVNRGRTCRKPLELGAAVHARDRATVPLMRERRDVGFRETAWDEAMPRLAARLRRVVEEHGPDAVGFYVSGQLLTEDYYAFAKLVKGFLGTNNLDSNSRLCMSSAVAGYRGAFGFDGPPPAYADLGLADCFLLVGTNTAACHPIVWGRIRDRQAEGASVICLDPRPTTTARAADLHLPLRPGTDLALLNALLHVIERDGLVDRAYVERSTSGFEEALAVARDWPPVRAAEVCGVDAGAIELAARRFARAPRSLVLWSMGVNQSVEGTATNRALINLCLATGQLGRPGSGPLSLTGQPNAMGGREAGGLAALLPGYRSVESEGDRLAMERHWDCPPLADRPGLPAVELFDALADGRVRAVWIVATNPLVSLPDSNRAREALERAELVVVQDAHHPTETSALAHAVLPAAAWPEKQGAMTNSERRVGLVQRALDPPGQALADWRIAARLAAALGHGEQFAWRDEADVYAEFAACTAGRPCDVSGVTHQRLLAEGSVQWPCPDEPGVEGRPRLYTEGRFPTPDGRARFAPTPYAGPAERAGGRYPLTLTTGRLADQWHTMTRTGKSQTLRAAAGEPVVDLHPADAREAGVAGDEFARVLSRRGSVVARVRLEPDLPRGVAYVPFHFGALHAPPAAGQANAVTLRAVDPVSGQPELKATAVRVEPLVPRSRAAGGRRAAAGTRRLVVVGTGRAALETVETALGHAADGGLSVTMLGEEPGPTYDRIGLSRLLARAVGLGDLELRPAAWYPDAGVALLDGTPAAGVDVDRALVRDAAGFEHGFDALVIATGSRPFVPPVPGVGLAHVHAFRTLADVDAITAACRGARSAAVVGGGLLGLEAAGGLKARGVPTTVIEASDRLMPQQLDRGGAALLERRLARLGIAALTGRRLASIEPDAVVLEDGERLGADLVVVAAGIRPEVALARAAGIETSRGIVVDDAMRTSAPGVWAVGECAQHRDTIYGLWAPIAEQARVAGASLCGAPAGFHGWIGATTLKVAGVDVFAGGGQSAGEGQVEVVCSDGRRGVYRKLVLENDRLAGAVLVGDASAARELSRLLREGGVVPEHLLGSPDADADSEPSPDGIVCSCNAVSRTEIEAAVRRGGLTTVAQVGRATRAGTGCGSCARDIARVLANAGPEQPARDPAVHRAETIA
jgi:ferredoxin-nitrate reductase